MHYARSCANPSTFRIVRLWKFGSRLWPWTSAILKSSLFIGFEIDDSQSYKQNFEKQAPGGFF